MLLNNTFAELVRQYKDKEDNQSLLCIIERMQPLINKYARSSYFCEYEDMKQELVLAIIESVKRIEKYNDEGKVIKYITNGIRNRFLELYRKYNKNKLESYCDIQSVECNLSFYEKYSDIEFYVDMIWISNLPTVKRKIAEYILFNEATDTEISKRLHISRQYVNRCKKEIFANCTNIKVNT